MRIPPLRTDGVLVPCWDCALVEGEAGVSFAPIELTGFALFASETLAAAEASGDEPADDLVPLTYFDICCN